MEDEILMNLVAVLVHHLHPLMDTRTSGFPVEELMVILVLYLCPLKEASRTTGTTSWARHAPSCQLSLLLVKILFTTERNQSLHVIINLGLILCLRVVT